MIRRSSIKLLACIALSAALGCSSATPQQDPAPFAAIDAADDMQGMHPHDDAAVEASPDATQELAEVDAKQEVEDVGSAEAGEDPGPPYILPPGCGPEEQTFDCDPLRNLGCTGSQGWVCDFASGGFQCYPPPNTGVEGEACNIEQGPLCGAGLTCAGAAAANPKGICRAFCCSDSGCTQAKTCHPFDSMFGSLGYCE